MTNIKNKLINTKNTYGEKSRQLIQENITKIDNLLTQLNSTDNIIKLNADNSDTLLTYIHLLPE